MVRIDASRGGAGHGRAHEQRAGFRALIIDKRHGGFAFPGLAGHDSAWRADRSRDNRDQQREPLGRGCPRQSLEGEHDQSVSGQHGDRRSKLGVNGGLAPSRFGVVKTGQIVMHERSAVQKLDGGCGRRRRGIAVAAGLRDRQTELWPDAVASGKDRVVQRRSQKRRRSRSGCSRNRALQGFLDAGAGLHGISHLCTYLMVIPSVIVN